jgi:branched-chain amino acid transport system substrate-binding protein
MNVSFKLLKLVFQNTLIIFLFAFAFPDPDYPYGGPQEKPRQSIKIGLLIPDKSYTTAVHGAELAIRKANKAGGLNGRHFQLIIRTMEGPWGTGSKQAVNLIFEEDVWALMGSHDGRNAHLVEQAATKSTVVLVSAWASDPTLTQAFVPWFFNCVPNDNQQAASLLNEIYVKRKFRDVAVVHGSDYDSGKSLGSFMNSVKMSGNPDPILFNLEEYVRKSDMLFDKISESGADCILFFCQPSAALDLIRRIKQKKMTIPLFGSLMLLNENELTVQELQELDNLLLIPAGEWPESANITFRQEYQKAFNKTPGMSASFSFDGMSVLIEAIKIAGSNEHEKIQKSLENIRYNGVTGIIQFDEKGNRMGKFEIMKTMNGIPLKFEKEIPR